MKGCNYKECWFICSSAKELALWHVSADLPGDIVKHPVVKIYITVGVYSQLAAIPT